VDREELSVLSRYPATPRRLLTVDEYHRMGEAGILTEDDRVELIEGELVAMAPIGSEHVAATNALTRLLVLAVGDRGIISVQNPVRLTRRSEPQPDLAVLKPRDDYRTTLPRRWPWKAPTPAWTTTALSSWRSTPVAAFLKSGS
jgi:Uma2 family endonuclease